MIGLKDILYVYRLEPREATVEHRLAGKVAQHGGRLEVLADYLGVLSGIEDPTDPRSADRWRALRRNPYWEVVPADEVLGGRRPDLLRQADLPQAGPPEADPAPPPRRPPATFEYHHRALQGPVRLESSGGKLSINGSPLSDQEAKLVIENLRRGTATLRYAQDPREQQLGKMEGAFASMAPGLEGELERVRGAARLGQLDPSLPDQLAREVQEDHGVGNLRAYRQFAANPPPGAHVRLDLNDLSGVNSTHSWEHGDAAIRALARELSGALQEVSGGTGRAFRVSGGEFHLHLQDPSQAALLARVLRSKLEQVPPVGGTHRLGVTVGIALEPEGAEAAHQRARAAKRAAGKRSGESDTHAFSGVPGAFGHVPLGPEALPIPIPEQAPQVEPT